MRLPKAIKYLTPILLFCLCYNYVKGQSALIQEQQSKLSLVKDSITLVNSLNRIGMLYHLKNPDSCFYYGMKAKAIAIRLHYLKGVTSADNVIASALYLKGLFTESLELFGKILLTYRQQLDAENTAIVLMNMSTVYLGLGDTLHAKMFCRRAIQTGRQLKKDSVMSILYANYCIVNSSLSADSAGYYVDKAQEIAKRYKDKRMLIVIMQLQANNLLVKDDKKDALPLIKQSLLESRKEGMEYFEINSLGLYADYYSDKPDSILSYYNRAYQLADKNGYVYLKVKVLKIILAYTEKSGNKDKIINVQNLIEKALVIENNNIKKFIGDYIKYNAIQDDNTLLQTDNKNSKAKIWLLISICVISILIIIFIYRLYQVSRRHEQRQLQLNQQVQAQNNALQEADEFKNKLLSILAHDFRAPLISTINIAHMMRDNPGITEEEIGKFYGDIEKDATRMLESFDTILQWIKQQMSGYALNTEKLALHRLFDESGRLFSQLLDEKKITLCNKIPEDMTVFSDREILQFVNRNLLSNSIRFSPEGGTIIIKAEQTDTDFTLTVTDNGPGMSAETISRLFLVSNQFVSPTQHGAGIALSMCKDFIQMLGGRIWAENKEPNGAVFSYTIPLKDLKAA